MLPDGKTSIHGTAKVFTHPSKHHEEAWLVKAQDCSRVKGRPRDAEWTRGRVFTSWWTEVIRTETVLRVNYLYHHHNLHSTTSIITMETITTVTITNGTT